MFSKLAIFTAFFVTLAVATPLGQRGGYEQCNTGTLKCCDQLQDPKDASTIALLALLGIPLQNTDAQVGLQCDPISVVGLLPNGGKCQANPVCCSDKAEANLVSLGCLPANVL
ncbi:fungal hydrophobin [Trametes gibbosa]|nr:fungal hydrophobin [Trametes gibbosa]